MRRDPPGTMRLDDAADNARRPAGAGGGSGGRPAPFRPPRWLRGAHLQTVAGRLLRPRTAPWQRERIETPDGDFLDLDFGLPPAGGERPFLLLLHGLEGSSSSGYMVESARRAAAAELLPIALNFRSRSGEPNRRPRSYHSGETGDLAYVVEMLAARFPGVPFGLLGYSLGGNVLLKYLGERGDRAHPRLAAACVVSVPFDLAASAARLERGPGRAYGTFFLRSLKRSLRAKAELFPGALDAEAGGRARTIREFDDVVTAPVHGFRDAADYYARSSSGPWLAEIRVPTLLLQAEDDPIVPREAFPAERVRGNPWLAVEVTRRGGHLGFVEQGAAGRPAFWAEREAVRFLTRRLAPGLEEAAEAPGGPASEAARRRARVESQRAAEGDGARAPVPAPPASPIGRPLALALLAATALACARARPQEAAGPAPASGLRLVEVARGLESPVHLAAPPGDARLFVVEQGGRIRILRDGAPLPRPFLDIRERVRAGGERGLLSVAFHPRYAETGTFFVNYTDTDGDTRVERYRASTDPDAADPASARLVLRVDQPFANHNGGHVFFGPDGMLYVGMGDGGSGGDPRGHGQNRNTPLGAMLRLDVDRGEPYAVPADNPFAGDRPGLDEIWAIGLRNPWRSAFDPGGELLYVADVGQNRREEVSVVPARRAGLNFGWNRMEGSGCFGAPVCSREGLVPPAVEYGHDEGCSITGGVVYRGRLAPRVIGHYFFSDYCSGWLRSFRYEGGRSLDYRQWSVERAGSITSFGEDSDGEMYVVTHEGRVLRLEEAR